MWVLDSNSMDDLLMMQAWTPLVREYLRKEKVVKRKDNTRDDEKTKQPNQISQTRLTSLSQTDRLTDSLTHIDFGFWILDFNFFDVDGHQPTSQNLHHTITSANTYHNNESTQNGAT